jgi:hypothetical protein
MSSSIPNEVRDLKIEELEAAVGGSHMSIKFAPEYTRAKAGSSGGIDQVVDLLMKVVGA